MRRASSSSLADLIARVSRLASRSAGGPGPCAASSATPTAAAAAAHSAPLRQLAGAASSFGTSCTTNESFFVASIGPSSAALAAARLRSRTQRALWAAPAPRAPSGGAASVVPVAGLASRADEGDSIPQLRFISKIEAALVGALGADAVVREQLVERHGFAVARVHASRDRRSAYIQWACLPGREAACERDLEAHAFRIRRAVASSLQAKRAPFLEFRRDAPHESAAALLEALRRAERDESSSAAASSGGADSGAGAGAESGLNSAVQIAAQRLEASMELRRAGWAPREEAVARKWRPEAQEDDGQSEEGEHGLRPK